MLDTLVAPQTKDVPVKGGTKAALFKFSELKAEKYELVKKRILELTKGKCLIAYHLPQKVGDLQLTTEDVGSTGHIDVAKIFNRTSADQQAPISALCEKYLNLRYSKRPSPSYAFTEAKISMALFK